MEGRKDGRMDGSVTISLCNSVGEGIITKFKVDLYNVVKTLWNKFEMICLRGT